jgi:PAS domain S-box-containing protein
MSNARTQRLSFWLLAALAALALIVGIVGLAAYRADRALRAELLQQASMVAMSVSPQQVAALSGTTADLASPAYQGIKAQLSRARASNPRCRFLYLMSRRPDGAILIHVDSEPTDSKDYSPPGQVYDEAPLDLQSVFATGQALVRGPYADRWGSWVSAFVPLTGAATGGVQTVFGMDIAAAGWKGTVALRSALPATLAAIAAMLGLLAALLYRSRRNSRAHQEVLRRRETQLRATLDSTADGVLAVDNEGKVILASRRFTELWRIPQSVMARGNERALLDFVLDQLTDPNAFLGKVLLLHGSDAVDLDTLTFKDGRFYERTSLPMIMEGIRIGRVWNFRDISARKLAEDALRRSEDNFRRLIENSHDIIYTLNPDGVFTFVSPAWTVFLGHPVDQVVGQPFQQFVHPDDLSSCMVFLKSVIETGQRQEGVEYRVRHTDGVWRWHTSSVVPLRDEGGTVIGFEGTARDETGRKLAEAQVHTLLEESNRVRLALLGIVEDEARVEVDLRRLAMAIEQTHDTVVVTDREGAIQYVNPAFEQVTGYSQQEALGQNPRILKSGKHDAEFYRQMWAMLATGAAWSGHLINKRKNGTLYEEDATISPVRDTAGNVINYVAVKRDVSHEVQLEAQLRQAQKMEAIGLLAGGVAHDFNNLLMGIMGYTELCRDKIAPDHPIREWLDEITRDAKRSAEITRQLLAFARKQTIAPKVLDINDAVAGMLKLLRRLIGEDINLAWMPGLNVPPVKIDPSQVDQILANLCVNARDAIAGVGKVTIETGSITIDGKFCARHPEAIPGAYVLLAVSDNGCGMNKETLDQVFEPFFTTKGLGKGTGLGLATVYGIVKQNNGFIYATSEPGQGTMFNIHLPAIAAEAEASVTSGAEAPRGRGEIILLVEDEKSLRVTCSAFLDALGYKVMAAETPGEALKMTDLHPGDIHLLLTDVVMPGMDGRQLAKRIGAVKPGVKALFMSGYTADVIAQRGVLDDGVQFLSKPFSRADLARKVRQVLEED